MPNILDIVPEYFMINDFKGCKDGSTINVCYCEENSVPHIAFNSIEGVFRKSGIYSYLIFCETDKNKNMLNNYVRSIDQPKEELMSWIDELDDDYFFIGQAFMRFKFTTDDELVYNQKINVPVCVISLSCAVKKGDIYYPQFRLEKCFYEALLNLQKKKPPVV